jgi:hypothetical protein
MSGITRLTALRAFVVQLQPSITSSSLLAGSATGVRLVYTAIRRTTLYRQARCF